MEELELSVQKAREDFSSKTFREKVIAGEKVSVDLPDGKLIFLSESHSQWHPDDKPTIESDSGLMADRIAKMVSSRAELLRVHKDPDGNVIREPSEEDKESVDLLSRIITVMQQRYGLSPEHRAKFLYQTGASKGEEVVVDIVAPPEKEGDNEELNRVRRELQEVQAELERSRSLNRSNRMNP